MRIYLKVKLGITIISISILSFMYVYNNAFYQTMTINKWGKLEWKDFDGIVKPFSIYDASIHSNVYVKYDSLKKTLFAYAGQNNKLSWKRNGFENDSLLLRHEQYHFNITEHFARRMNKILNKAKFHITKDYEHELKNIDEKLNEMQLKYDDETDHGLNRENQINWENKIDKLLE